MITETQKMFSHLLHVTEGRKYKIAFTFKECMGWNRLWGGGETKEQQP